MNNEILACLMEIAKWSLLIVKWAIITAIVFLIIGALAYAGSMIYRNNYSRSYKIK